MDKHQRAFHREAFSYMGDSIREKYNSLVVKLNQTYGTNFKYVKEVSNGDIGQLARSVMDNIDELKSLKSQDSDSNTFRGTDFLKTLADNLKEDKDPHSLYHEEKTSEKRKTAKDVIAFYLTLEKLSTEGVHVPEGLGYTTDENLIDILGKSISRDKGLTIDDASPELKKALLSEPKEVRDVYIGREHFYFMNKAQKERVTDKDIEHIDYSSKDIDIAGIIEGIKAREANLSNAKASKGKGIAD